MKKSILILGLIVFVVALLSQAVFAGTYYYGGQALYSDHANYNNYGQYGNYGNNYGNYYGNSPDYYYQGQYQYTQPYGQGFPDQYFYRGRSPSDYAGRYQNWGSQYDYSNVNIYDKITYEHREVYDFERARAYSTGNYRYNYLNPGYYNYPGNSYYFDGYGRNIY